MLSKGQKLDLHALAQDVARSAITIVHLRRPDIAAEPAKDAAAREAMQHASAPIVDAFLDAVTAKPSALSVEMRVCAKLLAAAGIGGVA